MKTIDRYIIRQFLINFLILLTVFILLFVVVDVIFNLDEFLEAGRKNAESWGGVLPATLWAMFDYYGPMSALLYVFFSGLIVVAAMGFTFTGLVRTGELNAMVTSGISMFRVAASVLVVGFLLNLLTLPNQEFVIPAMATKLTRSASQVANETIKPFEVSYAVDGNSNLVSAHRFDAKTETLRDVTIMIRNPDGLALQRVTAKEAHWGANARGVKGWVLQEGSGMRREMSGTPAADRGASQVEKVSFFATDLSPQVLIARRASIYPRLLSLSELQDLSGNPAVDGAQMRQIIHSRFSLLIVNALVLVMGLPFFLLREPANMLMQGVKAAAVCLGAWGMGLVMLQVGAGTLPPVMAAWLPVVIYLPVAAALLVRVRT